MSNEIINQNADEQEVAQAPAATTKSPVEDNMEEQPNNDSKPPVNDLIQKEESKEVIAPFPEDDSEGAASPDFHEEKAPVVTPETGQTEAQIHDAVLASPHDDFDWSVDKRNVTSYNKKEREKYDEVYDKTF